MYYLVANFIQYKIAKNYENKVACRQSYSKNNQVKSSFLRHGVDCRLNPAVLDIGPTV